MGNMAHTDMEYLRKGDLKFLSPPKIESVKAENIPARKRLSKYFEDEMQQTTQFFN